MIQCYDTLTNGESDMKKLNTILLLSLIVANMTTVVFADTNHDMFIAMTFTPSITSELKDKTADSSSQMLGVYIGHKSLISEKIGMYIGFDTTLNEPYATWEPTIYHNYTIFNAGLTFSPIKQLTVLAGVGYSSDKVSEKILIDRYFYYDDLVDVEDIKDLEKNNDINFNMELMYEINRFGIIAGYNSAPKAFNIGLSFSF